MARSGRLLAAPRDGVLTAHAGAVRLPWYEPSMTVATRWAASACEHASGAQL